MHDWHGRRRSIIGLNTHLFDKVPRPGVSEGTFLVFESSCHLLLPEAATCYYQSNHSKVEAIPLSTLPKDTTSELARLTSHYPFFVLNVKQGSCEQGRRQKNFQGGQ